MKKYRYLLLVGFIFFSTLASASHWKTITENLQENASKFFQPTENYQTNVAHINPLKNLTHTTLNLANIIMNVHKPQATDYIWNYALDTIRSTSVGVSRVPMVLSNITKKILLTTNIASRTVHGNMHLIAAMHKPEIFDYAWDYYMSSYSDYIYSSVAYAVDDPAMIYGTKDIIYGVSLMGITGIAYLDMAVISYAYGALIFDGINVLLGSVESLSTDSYLSASYLSKDTESIMFKLSPVSMIVLGVTHKKLSAYRKAHRSMIDNARLNQNNTYVRKRVSKRKNTKRHYRSKKQDQGSRVIYPTAQLTSPQPLFQPPVETPPLQVNKNTFYPATDYNIIRAGGHNIAAIANLATYTTEAFLPPTMRIPTLIAGSVPSITQAFNKKQVTYKEVIQYLRDRYGKDNVSIRRGKGSHTAVNILRNNYMTTVGLEDHGVRSLSNFTLRRVLRLMPEL